MLMTCKEFEVFKLKKERKSQEDRARVMVSKCACLLSHFSCVQLFAILWIIDHQVSRPWDSPSMNTRVGCHALLQGIFPTQGQNPCLLPALADRFFTTGATWEAQVKVHMIKIICFIEYAFLYLQIIKGEGNSDFISESYSHAEFI